MHSYLFAHFWHVCIPPSWYKNSLLMSGSGWLISDPTTNSGCPTSTTQPKGSDRLKQESRYKNSCQRKCKSNHSKQQMQFAPVFHSFQTPQMSGIGLRLSKSEWNIIRQVQYLNTPNLINAITKTSGTKFLLDYSNDHVIQATHQTKQWILDTLCQLMNYYISSLISENFLVHLYRYKTHSITSFFGSLPRYH